jgi:2,3-bisphosphoglycerate-independent phosphoglycerate mutase
LDAAKAYGLKDVLVHAFTDGRDVDPKSGYGFISELEDHLKETTGSLATVTGRYYAMDRDKRWERVKLAYDALVHGKGEHTNDILKSIQQSYE